MFCQYKIEIDKWKIIKFIPPSQLIFTSLFSLL